MLVPRTASSGWCLNNDQMSKKNVFFPTKITSKGSLVAGGGSHFPSYF